MINGVSKFTSRALSRGCGSHGRPDSLWILEWQIVPHMLAAIHCSYGVERRSYNAPCDRRMDVGGDGGASRHYGGVCSK